MILKLLQVLTGKMMKVEFAIVYYCIVSDVSYKLSLVMEFSGILDWRKKQNREVKTWKTF